MCLFFGSAELKPDMIRFLCLFLDFHINFLIMLVEFGDFAFGKLILFLPMKDGHRHRTCTLTRRRRYKFEKMT
jgi:hypothetical protein